MIATGIVPRTSNIDNNIAQRRAKRYVFYPLSDLRLHEYQSTSPVWNPNIKRGQITLLETMEYNTQVTNDVTLYGGGGGVQLGLEEMGTDAQVNFLMGMFAERGMTSLSPLVDVNPEIVLQVQDLIYKANGDKLPDTLAEFRDYFSSQYFDDEDQLGRLANKVISLMADGVNRAIQFSDRYCNSIEKEIQEFRAGKRVIKGSIDGVDKYYYRQLNRPVPRDKDLVFEREPQKVQVITQAPSSLELEAYKETLSKQAELINQLMQEKQAKEDGEEEIKAPKKK